MKRHQNIQKEIPISEKVKKMFRYSPSYDAQKCYSKLPLRNNNANAITNNFKNHEIDCQYSSVKQKHIQTNQCNDNSSWIAKLVNGIQDEDQENKNFHRLSQIETNSVTDLPEDSQDYGYNQFFMEPGESLFVQKNITQNQMTTKFDKQAPITKPMKKSIKQAMIQINMKQNNEGMEGPPVTRDNSHSKRQNHCKKYIQRQNISQPTKYIHKMSEDSKVHSNKNIRNSLHSRKPKLDNKRKMKTLQKAQQRIISTSNIKFNDKQQRKFIKSQNEQSTIQDQTCKRSQISSSTKKQSIQRIRYETEELPTRKNSFANKEAFQLCNERSNIVDAKSKDFNMKSLFDESNQEEINSGSQYSTIQSQSLIRKRIGSIKKNRKEDDRQKLNNFQSKVSKNELNKIQFASYKNLQCFKPNDIELSSKRDNNYTLNRKKYDQCILIDLQSNKLALDRNNLALKSAKIRSMNSNITDTRKDQNEMNTKRDIFQKQKVNLIESLNCERIRSIFNKIRLDQTNEVISKKNLKLRGLTEVEKTQLGSIISKIHYQSAEYNLQSFQNEFRKINIQCTLKGCLSHQKIEKVFEKDSLKYTKNSSRNILYQDYYQNQIIKNQSLKHVQNDQQPRLMGLSSNNDVYFQQKESFESMQYEVREINLKNRNFKVLKKKLFEQIQTPLHLDKIDFNQLPRNSRSDQKAQQNLNLLQQKNFNGNTHQIYEKQQNLSKDPYIQGPSVVDIQIEKRDMTSSKASNIKQVFAGHNNCRPIETDLLDTNDNSSCLIQRLNKKLSSYIDKNHIQSTYRQFNLNFSELKKHIR